LTTIPVSLHPTITTSTRHDDDMAGTGWLPGCLAAWWLLLPEEED